MHPDNIRDGRVFVARVREQRIARPEVHRGHSHLRKAGNVRPPDFRAERELNPGLVRDATGDGQEALGDGRVRPRPRTLAQVIDLDGCAGSFEETAHPFQGVVGAFGGREAVVDGHGGGLGDDVVRYAALDAHDGEGFAEFKAVNHLDGVTEGRDTLDDGGHRVNRVNAHPGARRVRSTSREVRDDAQSSVAAAFDVRGSGFAQQSEVTGEPLRVQALDAAQAIEVRGDLLVVVENPRDVCGEHLACATRD